MSGAGIHFKMFRSGSGEVASNGEIPGIADLWFSLARRSWSSVVLVPSDEGISASAVATALAQFGGRLQETPVTAILADSMDSESARIITDLAQRIDEPPAPPFQRVTVDAEVVATPPPGSSATDGAIAAGEVRAIQRTDEPFDSPPAKPGAVVVAIQPVVVEPLGVAIAQAASAVVLCVQLGRTRLASARRTMELIGPDRIVGAFLIP